MQGGEGQLHLGLHADGADHPAALGVIGQILEQSGLADACLALDHQERLAPARTASTN